MWGWVSSRWSEWCGGRAIRKELRELKRENAELSESLSECEVDRDEWRESAERLKSDLEVARSQMESLQKVQAALNAELDKHTARHVRDAALSITRAPEPDEYD